MNIIRDDLELLARWQAGERVAADLLVRRHAAALDGFFHCKASPQDREDLKQQVWLELIKGRPTEIRASFRAYLLGIARHVLLRHCTRRGRSWDPLTMSLRDLDPSLSQQMAEKLGAHDLRVMLQRLPFDVQLLLELRYTHDLSIAELAAMYDVPTGTMKRRLWQARRLLAAEMPPGDPCLPYR